MIHFMLMPTLCFQLHYPMLPRRRWGRVLKYLIEFVLITVFFV